MGVLDGARPGASVRCTDGVLGTLDRIDDRGGVKVLLVRGTNGAVAVPEGLVRGVRPDGTIDLSCGLEAAAAFSARVDSYRPATASMRLHEEELVAHKELREEGAVRLDTVVEEFPARLEVEALREEVEIEHRDAGREVTERKEPYQDGDYLVVPVYEEQLVVSKRLVLKEELRIRRIGRTEVRTFEDKLKRERVDITQPNDTVLVREKYEVSNGDRPARARR